MEIELDTLFTLQDLKDLVYERLQEVSWKIHIFDFKDIQPFHKCWP
jgi:hypothetical protein